MARILVFYLYAVHVVVVVVVVVVEDDDYDDVAY